MLNQETKQKINTARDILVGKIPDPKAQVEQITTALIYKFMDDMDMESEEVGGKRSFFTGDYEQYSWTKLLDSRLGNQDRMNLYNEATAKMPQNPKLPQLFRNIFKGYFLPYRDPETLSLFLKKINEFKYDHSEELGNAFEYLLSIMSSQGDAGQFRTPRHIIDFIVKVVDPKKDESILDPACGTAGFLISAYKHILEKNKDKPLNPDEKARLMKNIVGYDISPDMVKLSLVNLYLHGFPDPKILEYDTLTSEEKWNDSYDVILANPPFMSPKGGIVPHKKFKVRANRSEILFVDYITEHLSVDGKAGIIVPEGIIFQSGTAYRELRRWLIEDGYLWAVVSLPPGIFNPYSNVKTSILFIDKKIAHKTDSILFVDIKYDGFDLGSQRRPIVANDLPMSLEALLAQKKFLEKSVEKITEKWPGVAAVDTCPTCLMSLKSELKENNYQLSIDHYKETTGYTKNTWPMVKLGEIIEFEPKSKRKSGDGKDVGLYKFFVSSQTQNKYIDVVDYQKENLILGTGGTVSIHIDKNFSTSADTFVFHSKDRQIDNKYIYYLFLSNKAMLENGFRGQGIKHLSKEYLSKIEIPIPPFEIQKDIVFELNEYQKIIEGAKQVVNNWKPIITTSSDWNQIAIGNLGQLKNGVNFLRDEVGETLKIVGVKDFQDNFFVTPKNLEEVTVKKVAKEYFLEDGDILFVRSNGNPKLIGRCLVATEVSDKNIIFSGFTIRFRLTNKLVLPNYCALVLKQPEYREKLFRNGNGANIKSLNQQSLLSIKIPVPDIKTQKMIIDQFEKETKIISNFKVIINSYEKRIDKKIKEVWGE